MKQADLVPYIGSRSRVSEILRGKRTLSLSMIRSLHTHLSIPELAHLALGHVHSAEGQCIIDDLDLRESVDEIENKADELAGESLIPSQLWNSHPAHNTGKAKDILDLASKADIHKSIVAGRIRYERNNYRILWPHVGRGMVRKLFFS